MRPRRFKRSRTEELDEQQQQPKLARQSSGDPSMKLPRQSSGGQSTRLARQTSNGLDLQLSRQASRGLNLQLEQADSFSDLRADASAVRSPSHSVTSTSPTCR
eukprot:COSAG03_NODE_200_length_10751_cov_2.905745_2_plen_103_part_00